MCQLEAEDQYSLHHEFSRLTTEKERAAVEKMISYINERGNPFDISVILTKSLTSGEQLDDELVAFKTNCVTKGEEEYQTFKDERLKKKIVKLFDPIKKVKMKSRNNSSQTRQKPTDVKKETIQFMRNIDIARTRDYDLKELLQHEITSTSLYLTKDGYLRKSPKSELMQVIKSYIPVIPSEVSGAEIPSALIIDFMAYCRKVPIKKLLLKTYEDLARHLWGTFQGLSTTSQRIDIIFDLYLDRSIKQGERNRRSKEGVVETTILQLNQALPVEMEKFWGSSSNKMQLEQIFIEWVLASYKGSRPLFLGVNKDDITSCILISNGEVRKTSSIG